MGFLKKLVWKKEKNSCGLSYENLNEKVLLSYEITGYIGKGSQGKVYKVKAKSENGEEVALKVVEIKLKYAFVII